MNTKWLYLTIMIILSTSLWLPVAGASPYEGYNYSYWREATASPNPYIPVEIMDGERLGIGNLNAPGDLFVTKENQVYVLDSGNNRIAIFDEHWNLIREIKEFQNQTKTDGFKNPQGLFVTDEGSIYVADTENQRIVELKNDGTMIREIGPPESDVLREGFTYFPIKIVVDKAKRIYVIGRGIFDGIMEFDADGNFTRFMGTNRVKFNAADYFWKQISTKAQREQMRLFLPIEFNNLDLDPKGFIYTTTSEQNSQTPIQRLNPTGIDVLRRTGYAEPRGDLEFPPIQSSLSSIRGSSIFVDIDVDPHGLYSALDSTRGRIFTYNDDGDLLYIFGKLGEQVGTFKFPVAIERLRERMLVLDRNLNRITLFEPTQFGLQVNKAVALHQEGLEEQSAEVWKQVLKLNANYEIAYVGIGKALLRQDKHEEAIQYFHLGNNRKYYSKAYGRYRVDAMTMYFGGAMTALILLSVCILSVRAIFKRKKSGGVNADAI